VTWPGLACNDAARSHRHLRDRAAATCSISLKDVLQQRGQRLANATASLARITS
jgi:hypothetical protein